MEALLQFFGRTHPMVLHLPIGLFIGLAAIEAIGAFRKRAIEPATRLMLVWLGALSALAAASSGLLLGRESAYSGSTVQTHQWLGIAVAGSALAAALGASVKAKVWYVLFLVTAVGLMIPAGHLGAGMTHGENFLLEPFERRQDNRAENRPGLVATVVPRPPAPAMDPGAGKTVGGGVSFGRDVLPVFEAKCVSCHAEAKRKGGLALHSLAALMEGGDLGPVVVPGDAGASDLVERLKLPVEHDDHMPPKAKAQLTAGEVDLISRWVTEGGKE